MGRRTTDVWLVLWGIFIALFIQSVSDYAGSVYSPLVEVSIGVGTSSVAFTLLAIWIVRINRTTPKENGIRISKTKISIFGFSIEHEEKDGGGEEEQLNMTKANDGTIEGNKDAFLFFSGIIIAIFGSVFVSSLFEIAQSILEREKHLTSLFFGRLLLSFLR